MIQIKTKTKHTRCAYCHGETTGELCACGGMHLDCSIETKKCLICGKKNETTETVTCHYCMKQVRFSPTDGSVITENSIVVCAHCENLARCRDCGTIYKLYVYKSQRYFDSAYMNRCKDCGHYEIYKRYEEAAARHAEEEDRKFKKNLALVGVLIGSVLWLSSMIYICFLILGV